MVGPGPLALCPLVGLRGGWGVSEMNTFSQHGNPKRERERESKKRAFDSDSEEEQADRTLPRPVKFPRYYMIEGTDETRPMSKTTPTKGNLILRSLIGTVERVIRLGNGNLIVGLQREGQVSNLMGITSFGNSPCKVSPHTSMNSKKGVIRCSAYKGIAEEEIVEDLSSEGVTNAKKTYYQRDGQKRETATIILTFDCPELPKEIKAGYLIIKVEPYIPNPLRCFGCNRFGHPKDRCKRKACCARCGSTEHIEDRECQLPPHCVNCEGEHSSFSKDCPKWREEKEIQRVKVTQNITFQQARQQVTPTKRLYADAVTRKTPMRDCGTQYDIADTEAPRTQTVSQGEMIPPTQAIQPREPHPPNDISQNYSVNNSALSKKEKEKKKKKHLQKNLNRLSSQSATDILLQDEETMETISPPTSPTQSRSSTGRGPRSPIKPP